MVDPKYPVRAGIANSDILKCYVAMLTLGKNDFEAVEAFRQQRFAHQALGLRAVPSSATLRQRFDAMGCENGANWPTRAFARSTFKTDMDLNRLPSGKFATHHLVCALAALAMNLLRIVGQYTLHESGLKHGSMGDLYRPCSGCLCAPLGLRTARWAGKVQEIPVSGCGWVGVRGWLN